MKIITYFKDSYNELVNKVTWPTWKDLMNSALVVMTASLLISIVIFAMDLGFRNLMEQIYKLLY
ncbi:MAG: preprotein translocase subunit SecE [Bacteroidales bacterium]|nr:preprotein translocase subunit SecE [Bacteroidales bacterium]